MRHIIAAEETETSTYELVTLALAGLPDIPLRKPDRIKIRRERSFHDTIKTVTLKKQSGPPVHLLDSGR